ncbi:hypothetical protein KW453_20985 [Vibrio fluvialis]|nr:hypothetical protein [Vibrio fluvialis]MBY7980515.1 hypothetical protein [Vibrio fluvialis]
MANERDLICLMSSRKRLWSPAEICEELGIHVCSLVLLVNAARKAGADVQCEFGEHTANTSKYWLLEES